MHALGSISQSFCWKGIEISVIGVYVFVNLPIDTLLCVWLIFSHVPSCRWTLEDNCNKGYHLKLFLNWNLSQLFSLRASSFLSNCFNVLRAMSKNDISMLYAKLRKDFTTDKQVMDKRVWPLTAIMAWQWTHSQDKLIRFRCLSTNRFNYE